QGRWGGVALQACSIRDPSFPDRVVFVNEKIRRYNFTTLTFTAGDGTEYELRDSGTSGQPLLYVSCPSLPGLTIFPGANRGRVFSSTDGSAVTFISDSDIYDNVTLNNAGAPFVASGYLMLRDGTRYRIDLGNVTWIRDRNGNKLSFTYDSSRRLIA